MVADLLAAAAAAGIAALPSVARILVGGGGMSPALQQGLAALCPAATVHTAYGMTEGASSLTFHTLWGPSLRVSDSAAAEPADQPAAASAASAGAATAAAELQQQQQAGGPAGGVYVGKPPPGIELAIYQPPAGELATLSGAGGLAGGGGGSGRILLAGEGEVVTRGPHVMLGYWDEEEATAAVQLPGGWLRTGDLGCLRQGERRGSSLLACCRVKGACCWHGGSAHQRCAGPLPVLWPSKPWPLAMMATHPSCIQNKSRCCLLPAGQLWLLGRAKDMIKSGGENVHAWEVSWRCEQFNFGEKENESILVLPQQIKH